MFVTVEDDEELGRDESLSLLLNLLVGVVALVVVLVGREILVFVPEDVGPVRGDCILDDVDDVEGR